MGLAKELERHQVAEVYGRWAPVYDIVFGPVFSRGRRAAVSAAERVGGRILEVGVGTGLSLDHYTNSNHIVGVEYLKSRCSTRRGSELSGCISTMSRRSP